MGKGFAIGSALLDCLAYVCCIFKRGALTGLNILDPLVLVGMFIGAAMPFLISCIYHAFSW